MALFDNAKVVHVIAFTTKGHPIHKKNKKWKVTFLRPRTVRLSTSGYKHDYDLTTDVQCFHVVSEQEKAAIGGTLTRLALTGIASNALKKGAGLGGALLDLSIRGTDRRKLYSIVVAFSDMTVITQQSPI